MLIRLIMILGLLSLLVVSCSDDNPVNSRSITGSGDLDTEDRTVTAFKSIDMQAVGDVQITEGPENSVIVTVDDNVIDHILTTVENEELTIAVQPFTHLSDYDLTVTIMLTDLESVTLSGTGNIAGTNTFHSDTLTAILTGTGNIVLNLNSDYVFTSHTGVGNFVYNGTVTRHQIALAGVGNVAAFDFISDTTSVNLSGTGNVSVYVDNFLDVNVSGSGNILYKGQPTLQVVFTGEGQVIDAN